MAGAASTMRRQPGGPYPLAPALGRSNRVTTILDGAAAHDIKSPLAVFDLPLCHSHGGSEEFWSFSFYSFEFTHHLTHD